MSVIPARMAAPTIRSTACPFLNTMSVGIERMPYADARRVLASTSSLATLTRPLYAVAIRSITGASARQGPHQSA